jgi:hypothetical protein
MADQLVGGGRRAGLELDVGERRLAPLRIGPRHDGAGHHGGVAVQRVLHLDRADVLAAEMITSLLRSLIFT